MRLTARAEFVAPTDDLALLGIAMGRAEGFRASPLEIPPNWLPGYVMETRSNDAFVLSIVMTAITVVVVITRLISRWKITGWLGSDDWWILPATVLCGLHSLDLCLAAKYGALGKHGWDVKYEEAVAGVRLNYPNLMFYAGAMWAVKMSIMCFVHRLAGPAASTRMRWVIVGSFIFFTIFAMSVIFAVAFQCLPVRSNWDLSLRFHPDTHCKDYHNYYFITSTIHAIGDCWILALPIKMTWSLRMPAAKKALVVSMFAVGFLACACSVARMAFIYDYTKSTDVSWDSWPIAIFGVLEVTLSIIIASLPGLKPVFARYLPGLLSSIGGGNSQSAAPRWEMGERRNSEETDGEEESGSVIRKTGSGDGAFSEKPSIASMV